MVISGFAAVSIAASVGISPSMAWSVPNQSPSKRSMSFTKATAERTPTYTSTVRSGDIVRGLAMEPYVLDWLLETAVMDSRAVLTRTPVTSPPAAS